MLKRVVQLVVLTGAIGAIACMDRGVSGPGLLTAGGAIAFLSDSGPDTTTPPDTLVPPDTIPPDTIVPPDTAVPPDSGKVKKPKKPKKPKCDTIADTLCRA